MSNRNKLNSAKSPLPQITLDPEQQAKFEYELAWCIGKLESGVYSEKDQKKVNDAIKYANTLKSPSISLIKKRQLMSNLFGDYRSKIKQEENNNNNKSMAKMVDQSKLQKMIEKSKFIRSSKDKIKVKESEIENVQIENLNEQSTETKKNKFVMKSGNETFKFDFNPEN